MEQKKKSNILARRTDDILDAYVSYQDNTEPPDIFKKWVGISMIAACMQRKCWLQYGNTSVYPNMYIVLVAPPGRARKGTSMRPAKSHLDALNIKIAAEATTRQALIRRIAEAQNTFEIKDERGTNPMAHCSLTIFSDELTVFLGYSNKELMAHLADWFDSHDRWIYETKGSGTDEITNLWVNILGATTPELMQATMPMELMGGGLASRMIFVYASQKKKKAIFPTYDEKIRKDVEHDLSVIADMKGKFVVTKNFIRKWAEYYTEKPEACPLKSRLLNYYWERREIHLLKLSLIMSASRSNEQIVRVCDFDRAMEFIEEVEQQMHMVFTGMGHSDNAHIYAQIVEAIKEVGRVKRSKLVEAFIYDIPAREIDDLIQTLKTSGVIKLTKLGKDDLYIEYNGGI